MVGLVEGFRLSPQQEHLALSNHEIDGLVARGSVHQARCSIRIEGELDESVLRSAVSAVIGRHEILRTVFEWLPGVPAPLQVIREQGDCRLESHDLSGISAQQSELEVLWQQAWQAPFDLESGPPLHLTLVRIGVGAHWLIAGLPALCSDRLGLRNFVFELSRALSGDAEEPELQYADCAEAFAGLLESEETEDGREFWRTRGRIESGSASRPGERGADARFVPRFVERPLPREVTDACERLGLEWQIQPVSVYLAAWQALLWRLTDSEKIHTGVVLDGRSFDGLDRALGLFERTLPLTCSLAPTQTFGQLVQRVDAGLRELEEFQDYYDWGKSDRVAAEALLCPFGFEQVRGPWAFRAGDRILTVEREHVCTERFKLKLSVIFREKGLVAEIGFDAGRLSAADADRWAERFVTLLGDALADPGKALSELELLGSREREWLLGELNDTTVDLPGAPVLHREFETQAARTPDRTAILFEDRAVTYAELDIAANRLAWHLKSRGVGVNSRVGICLERSVEMVAALLAVLKAGGAYVPLDPDYPAERLAFMREDAGCSLVLTQQALLGRLPPEDSPRLCLDRERLTIEAQSHDCPPVAVAGGDLAYVIYTSGSTGRPKGVMVSHRAISNRLRWMAHVLPLADDIVLHKTPLSFDASIWEIFSPLREGATLLVAQPGGHQETDYLARLIVERQVTVLQMVPPQLKVLLDEPKLAGCKTLRRVFCGGDVLSGELRGRFHSMFAADLHNLYGPTEVSIDAASWKCRRDSDEARVPIGRPLANLRLYVVDDRGLPVPVGVQGELLVGGPSLARGYLHSPRLTAERFIPDPFGPEQARRLYATGDLARHRPDGALLFLGRKDHQVKIRGARVELGEIESALAGHPSVHQAVVLARLDATGEKRLVAYTVSADSTSVEADEMRRFLRDSLPEFEIPASFVVLEALPLQPNGKIDRRALPAPEEKWRGARRVPRTSTEELLAEIWAEVLEVDQIGRDDSFFDLGGHSLLATKLASRLRQVFETEISLRLLFDHPRLVELAVEIDRCRHEQAEIALPTIQRAPEGSESELSHAQQRLWFLDQLEPGGVAFNLPSALRLDGPLNVAALTGAFRQIVRRHETLRTTFTSVDGKPRLSIDGGEGQSLPLIDLGALTEEDRDLQGRRLIDQEAWTAFDLAARAPLRARLVRLDERRHIVLFTIHHIAGDGWSSARLIVEFAIFYRDLAAGSAPSLAAPKLRYSDFALWQRQWLAGDALDAHLDYWRRQLRGAPTVLRLPTDHQRPMRLSSAGRVARRRMPVELSRQVAALTRREGVTNFMVLAAGLTVLLHFRSGQEDIVLGSDIANRDRLEIEDLVGFLVNQLPLRMALVGDPTFREVLLQFRETALGAYAHQDVPFDKVVEAVQPERSLGHAPLFQVKLNLHNMPLPDLGLGELTLEQLEIEKKTAQLDLIFNMVETDHGFRALVDYKTDLFEHHTIGHLLEQFEHLLQQVCSAPEMRLSELREALAAADRQREEEEELILEQARRKKFRRGTRHSTAKASVT